MLGLGRPCALHALCPGVLLPPPPLPFQAACRSLALGEASGCSLPGARALVGLQVEPSPAGEGRRPLRHAERRFPLLPSCVRGCFPAGAGSPSLPTGREREPRLLVLLLLLRKPAAAAGEAADPRWLHAEISLRATGTDLPAGGERSSSLGARKVGAKGEAWEPGFGISA